MSGPSAETGNDEPSHLYSPSFEVVLPQAQQGIPEAFEQLYRALSGRVLSFARLRGAADPEGLVNDVFLNVFRAIGTFSGVEAQFNAWVFRIATNKLIDETRRAARRPIETDHDGSVAIGLAAPIDVAGEAIANTPDPSQRSRRQTVNCAS